MAYIKQSFVDNETVLKAEHLNHIENGISSLDSQTNMNGVEYFHYDFLNTDSLDTTNFTSGYDSSYLVADSGFALQDYANSLIFNHNIVLDYVKIIASVTITTDFDAVIVLGSKARSVPKHGSNIIFDFANKQMKIMAQSSSSDFSVLPTTEYVTADISSLVSTTSDFRFDLEVGRRRRQVYAAITNYRTGKRIEITAEETEGNYVYPAGWLYDVPRIAQSSGTQAYLTSIRCWIPTDVKCVFLGDSITQGYGIPAGKCWATKCCDYFGNSVNMGRSGGTLPDDVSVQIAQLLPLMKPKYVVVTIGTNGGNTAENLAEMVTNIKNLGAVPIVNRIYRKSSSVTSVNSLIAALNELSSRFDYATSTDNKLGSSQNTSLYLADKVHLNEDGGQVVFERFIADCGFINFLK